MSLLYPGEAELDDDWIAKRLLSMPTEATPQAPYPTQTMSMPDPSFRPGVQTGGGLLGLPGGMMSAEQADTMRQGSIDLFTQLGLLGGAPSPAAAEAKQIASARARTPRNLPPGRRGGASYETIDPDAPVVPDAPAAFGVGHNKPPIEQAIWANPEAARDVAQVRVGRMGSKADDQLAKLGLPTYAEMTPSTNTGPVSEAQIRGDATGSPVRPGQVFDLSDTWRVPDVPQTPLARIDPNAGRRKGLPEHIEQATTDPVLRAKLRGVVEAGLKQGGAYWYNAEPLRQAFVSELGQDEGNAVFSKYMSTVGAVSAGSDVAQNIRTGSYYNVRERQGDPVQGKQNAKGRWQPIDVEKPYGHKMQDTQYGGYRDIADGEPLDPQMRPKRASFDTNLQGNQYPVTVDKHNLRLIGMLSQHPDFLNTKIKADVNFPSIGVAKGESINFREALKTGRVTMDQLLQIPQAWKDVPDANHYGALEAMQQSLAQEMGLSPAQLQAALWVGGGRATGLKSLPTSFMGALEGKLVNTAQKRGISPTEALLEFVRGQKPLLTPLLAGGGAASLLYPEEDQRQ
jgi:hypothetical protein